ncbi:hypothetical protein JHK84_027791 [Glycine max]|uniref:ATP-dependent DNA helicase n=1 Tax=Glycine max TaxID=3847 RepID=A0A0R0HRK4_SOYBN|nr:hypothetical protein JHK87_027430 [Glycine soja]KAG5003525.1 hypothetical protein JHK86_027664 [Glycine max]KAG5151319.1 hypothetical protein JHK84_027791 [Glycine max]
MFFLYGFEGIHKTFMWQTLASALRSKRQIVLTLASSEIASLLLPHNSICNIHQGSEHVELLKLTKLIIWDEAPMAHKHCLEVLDKSLRDIIAITPEFLHCLRTSGLPNHQIRLKVGTPIMLLRNLDQSKGLCNGTRLIVTKLVNYVIEAEFMSSEKKWPLHLYTMNVVSYYDILCHDYQQIPNVGLYLPKPICSHGQLYVAISIVRKKNGMKILIHDNEKNPLKTTTNVVFKEVFHFIIFNRFMLIYFGK